MSEQAKSKPSPTWPGFLDGDALELWRFLWDNCRGGMRAMVASKVAAEVGVLEREIHRLTHELCALGFPVYGCRSPVAGVLNIGICILVTGAELAAARQQTANVLNSHQERYQALCALRIVDDTVAFPEVKLPTPSSRRGAESQRRATADPRRSAPIKQVQAADGHSRSPAAPPGQLFDTRPRLEDLS